MWCFTTLEYHQRCLCADKSWVHHNNCCILEHVREYECTVLQTENIGEDSIVACTKSQQSIFDNADAEEYNALCEKLDKVGQCTSIKGAETPKETSGHQQVTGKQGESEVEAMDHRNTVVERKIIKAKRRLGKEYTSSTNYTTAK